MISLTLSIGLSAGGSLEGRGVGASGMEVLDVVMCVTTKLWFLFVNCYARPYAIAQL